MRTLFLGSRQVKSILSMADTLKAVETAFRYFGRGEAEMPCKVYLFYPKHDGDIRVMPSYIPPLDISGVKVVNVHPNNAKRNLLSVMGTYILIDPRTGFPQAVMDATWITTMRTGAASGVATKYLARRDAEVLALIGTGAQADTQLEAVALARGVRKVKLFDANRKLPAEFARRHRRKYRGVEFYPARSVRDCVADADVICTLTPVRRPIVKSEWIKPGCHINAIGADAPGKQELDPAILKKAKVVIDDWEQASHSGEINVPLAKGLIKKRNIHAEIGKVVAGLRPGRTSESDITVFDSTGLGLQDLTTARRVFDLAKKKKVGRWLGLV
ncbi:MAG: alanine dehydrogenase [candidate division WOR-3 bacterium]|nr:MAG: alanine dehydrogenase [candidate division WOR-3 bacterium]